MSRLHFSVPSIPLRYPPQGPHAPLEKIRCHTAPATAGRKSRHQCGGALGVFCPQFLAAPSSPSSRTPPTPPAPEPILMRPLCCMKMVSLVRFPWMMGGLQACRKLQRERRAGIVRSGVTEAVGTWRGKPRPSPECRQDLRAPALPGLLADGLCPTGAGEAAAPMVPTPHPHLSSLTRPRPI